MVGYKTTLTCDISVAGENDVTWAYYDDNNIRRYISWNDFIYPSHEGRVEMSTDRNRKRYEMVLKNPQIADSWRYECGYVFNGIEYKAIMTTVLTVLSITDSQSCLFHQLPILPSSRVHETEVTCLWSHSKDVAAHFQKKNGDIIGADLRHSDRIISRKNSVDVSDINCVALTLDNETISTSCTANNAASDQGLVRVDPFLAETV